MTALAEGVRELSDTEQDSVTGGDNGVVAGPNGEGCTEPKIPTKPGQDVGLEPFGPI